MKDVHEVRQVNTNDEARKFEGFHSERRASLSEG
jgi:hypothetical protein